MCRIGIDLKTGIRITKTVTLKESGRLRIYFLKYARIQVFTVPYRSLFWHILWSNHFSNAGRIMSKLVMADLLTKMHAVLDAFFKECTHTNLTIQKYILLFAKYLVLVLWPQSKFSNFQIFRNSKDTNKFRVFSFTKLYFLTFLERR